MQHILEDAFNGQMSDFYSELTESPLARLHILLRTDEKHLIRIFFTGITDQFVFFEGQCEWFLTEYMLTCLECLNRNFGMPVIGCYDADNVDVLAIQ